jgi:hypothetical protein
LGTSLQETSCGSWPTRLLRPPPAGTSPTFVCEPELWKVLPIPIPLELGLKLEGDASWLGVLLLTAPLADDAWTWQLCAKSGHVTTLSVGGLVQLGGLLMDRQGVGKVGSPLYGAGGEGK